MNINFIGKDFEKLKEIDNYVNYEFEPKTNEKYGKRNIFFDELKHEFKNDINIFGFSPYIFQTIQEQRKNPNIVKFINKKFNYGYTNYIAFKSKNKLPFSSAAERKNKLKDKKENKRNKIIKLIPQMFLIKKEKTKNKKIEEKGNFLKKTLDKMGGYKLNIYEERGSKESENKKEINNLITMKRRKGKNNNELMKDILLMLGKKEKNKSQNFDNIDIFGNPGGNHIKMNIKPFFDNIQKNMGRNHSEKNIITLTKNRYILGNKRLLSTLSNKTKSSFETDNHYKTIKNSKETVSLETSRNSMEYKDKNKYLLFAKAIRYKYIKNKRNSII